MLARDLSQVISISFLLHKKPRFYDEIEKKQSVGGWIQIGGKMNYSKVLPFPRKFVVMNVESPHGFSLRL